MVSVIKKIKLVKITKKAKIYCIAIRHKKRVPRLTLHQRVKENWEKERLRDEFNNTIFHFGASAL